MTVTNAQELDLMVERVAKAQAEYATFSQAQVDKISAQRPLPLPMHVSRWQKWPPQKLAWVSLKTK